MQLIIFLFTMLIGIGSLSFILFMSIQSEQWLDMLFKWQKKLREWDTSGTTKGMILSKIFGYCELCFSHLIAFIGFWITLALTLNLFEINIDWWVYIFWYLFQVSISTNINLFFIKKLFK